MAKIIQFPVSKEVYERNVRRSEEIERRRLESEPDRFEKAPERKKKKVGYTLEQMTALIGIEKADEIFSKLASDSTSDILISPPDGRMPLMESLRQVWDDSAQATAQRTRRARQLSKMSSAFKEYERLCSKAHNERYGENVEIKIKIQRDDEEVFLTDELDNQAAFYRKGKIPASIELLGRRLNYGLDCIVDRMKID